jgi:hypothetical protein
MQTMTANAWDHKGWLTDGAVYWVVVDPITGGVVVIGKYDTDTSSVETNDGSRKDDCILKGVYDKRPA